GCEVAGVAQSVEHLPCKQGVRGSSPLVSSKRGADVEVEEAGVSARRFKERRGNTEGCPSGQREQAVNLPALAYDGSNPSPSTPQAGVAQLAERQPSKLNVAGSNPVSRSESAARQSRPPSSVGRARPW